MNSSTATPESPLAAAPVLDATGNEPSLDWPDGEYSVSVAGARGQWQVQHNISGAVGITDLIEAGHAMFAAEARCPRTLFSHLALSQSPTMELRFDESMTREPVFVVPGVMAIADCDLSTTEAAVIWRRAGSTVPVKKGMWLARGRAVKEDLASSLLLVEIVDWQHQTAVAHTCHAAAAAEPGGIHRAGLANRFGVPALMRRVRPRLRGRDQQLFCR